mmetsp:Transcript_5410/g.7819  ORF Transcript_5410/g.7819 Transcript_5410/m.7819 type:complete len:453 (+) Transcript_5410:25-1383(+)
MWEEIDYIEKKICTGEGCSSLRYEFLKNVEDMGFAARFVPMLHEAVEQWLFSFKIQSVRLCDGESYTDKNCSPSVGQIHNTAETRRLRRLLKIHSTIATEDSILSEELGMQGSHIVLTKLIRLDINQFHFCEDDQDAIMALQDMACTGAASCSSFPLKFSPYTKDELKSRLPLIISFRADNQHDNSEFIDEKEVTVLIQQVTLRQGAQEDVGFVLWPSSVVLARWILYNPDLIQDKSILELGAGCGLVGLLAAKIQKRGSITLSDFNPIIIKNLKRNIELNSCVGNVTAQMLDFYQQSGNSKNGWIDGSDNKIQESVDLILAADMICQPTDAVAAARTIHDSLSLHGKAFIVCADSRHRFGVEFFEEECRRLGMLVAVRNVANLYDGKLIDDTISMTAGYVKGMSLSMFTVEKIHHNLQSCPSDFMPICETRELQNDACPHAACKSEIEQKN